MTLPRLKGFAEYWQEAPPVCEVAAAWLGTQGKSSIVDEEAPDLLTLIPRRGVIE